MTAAAITGSATAPEAVTAPKAASANGFHALRVSSVETVSADGSAVMLGFDVPQNLRPRYAFTAGQHVTVRITVAGVEVRRPYSLCSTPTELTRTGKLRIGVRTVPGGAFSLHTAGLRTGDELDVMTPRGSFTTALDPGRQRHYAAIVAGSGVTPLMSLAASALDVEAGSTFTLLYANRGPASTMFIDELAQLKDRFLERFELYHLVSRGERREGLRPGRPDTERLGELLPLILDTAGVDEWFLCGPQELCHSAESVLTERGVPGKRIRSELFHAPTGRPTAIPPLSTTAAPSATSLGILTTIAFGSRTSTPMLAGATVLDSALVVNTELPYSCTTGVCGTCRAVLVAGEVEVGDQWALSPDEIAAGQILTCQARPRSSALTIDYDVS